MHSQRKLFSTIAALVIISGASLGSGTAARASGTTGTISLSSATAGAVENLGVRTIAVNRTGGSLGAASVLCSTANGTAVAGKDYTAVSRVITWASGDATVKWCNVAISDATPYTGQKTFYVKLSNPAGAPLGTYATTKVTIYGNKGGGLVSLSATSYTVAQNAGSVTISVNRYGGSVGESSLNYATANGTAIAGINYTSERGTIGWGNGDTAPKKIVIPISNATPFTGTKKFAFAIAGAEIVSLGTITSAIVTINGSAGTAPSVSLSASPTSVTSGGGSTLSWSATNATACTASGAWTGSLATSGSKATGALTASKTYTLTCTGSGGSTTKSATVNVSAPLSVSSTGLSCTGTSGPLTLRAKAVRDTGISPLLVFFDATGTTDTSISGGPTTFQDVTYTWNFGDTGASGTDTWAYGSRPGHNSRNTATGGVAAHLYVTPGVDTAYVATVTAHNGAYTASCQLGVTAHDPARANGFAGTKTTCVSASGTPVAGSGGCPAGAAVLNTSSAGTALNGSRSGKRTLFKCGDTFTGGASLSGVTWSVGAYGGCQDTQSNRPIMRGTFNVNMQSTGDGRIADLNFESTGGSAVLSNSNYDYIPYQITLYNLLSNGNNTSFYTAQGAQWGYIQLVQTGMGVNQGTFINYAQNNQSQWGTNSLYNNIDYQAVLGSSFNGVGAPNNGAGIEPVRVSACRMCVFENNVFENANNVGSVFKLHNGNTKITSPTWTGVYTELIEISDNVFSGTSGAILVDTAPQNGVTDERLRNIVVERNIFAGQSTGGGRQILVSAVNETLRDNVFNQSVAGGGQGVQVAERGIEPVPQFVEIYNNTCYEGTCAAFSGTNFAAPGINSWAENNLCYLGSCISNSGAGNTVGNNSASTSSNPGFTNASGGLKIISDFKPTANFTGATSVPVWLDALRTPWSPTWNLGAVHD